MLEPTHNPVALLQECATSNVDSIESDKKVAWAWALGSRSRIVVEPARTVRIRLQVPIPGSAIRLTVDDQIIDERITTRPWEELKGEWTGTAFEISCDRWNGQGGHSFADDPRELSVLFFEFSEVSRTQSSTNRGAREDKICLYPFARMETNFSGFTPCCRRWFVPEYSRFEAGEDPWNGPAAQELRSSILDGSYRWCDRSVCNVPLFDRSDLGGVKDQLGQLSASPENIAAILKGEAVMPSGPTAITFTSDPRCNLACPSCRSEKIFNLSEGEAAEIQQLEKFLEQYRNSIRKLTFATNGEVFFSSWLREQLRTTTQNRFPSLDFVEIHSNGLLFNQETIQNLRPGTDWIRRIAISIDAGNEKTYQAVRGGDWQRLMQNLRWISGCRKSGRFTWLSLRFVLRRENWQSLEEFLTLAENFGADEVIITRLQKWELTNLNHQDEDVADPTHPESSSFKDHWQRIKIRSWSFSIKQNFD